MRCEPAEALDTRVASLPINTQVSSLPKAALTSKDTQLATHAMQAFTCKCTQLEASGSRAVLQVGVYGRRERLGGDIAGLQEMIVYGIKGAKCLPALLPQTN
eukprot:TRINITY_DN23300_c0_g1_i1.p3 TRINITY_DN23300_c0_g1~~TRINITY_DN23300_c0_g1_i1.p3  ORF type:complete len:102 (+),score=2.78 TRINITY_DN23300_c0_g1_i1:38-343(+)